MRGISLEFAAAAVDSVVGSLNTGDSHRYVRECCRCWSWKEHIKNAYVAISLVVVLSDHFRIIVEMVFSSDIIRVKVKPLKPKNFMKN